VSESRHCEKSEFSEISPPIDSDIATSDAVNEGLAAQPPCNAKKAKDAKKVPIPDSLTVESASCRPVFFETSGRIHGPALVTLVARTIDRDGQPSFWLCVDHANSWCWISASILRSREAFELQLKKGGSNGG
jgi:hypothetical protein